VEEAVVVVDDATKHRLASLKPSSKDDIIVEAEIFLTRAKLNTALLAVDCEETCCMSEDRDNSKMNAIELPLELSVCSTRQIAGLMQYLFSEKRTDPGKSKRTIYVHVKLSCLNFLANGLYNILVHIVNGEDVLFNAY
jgi:hypothetical protein